MKAIEFLDMIMTCRIPMESMGMVTIDKSFDYVRVFGGEPSRGVENGLYAYVNADKISDDQFVAIENAISDMIVTDEESTHEPGVPVMYMLFEIEEPQPLNHVYL